MRSILLSKFLVLVFALGVIGCAHEITYQPREAFHDQVQSQMAATPLFTFSKESLISLDDCKKFSLRSKERAECLNEAITVGIAKINLMYPYLNESFVRNTYIANRTKYVPITYIEYCKSVLKMDTKGVTVEAMSKILDMPDSDYHKAMFSLLFYELMARSSDSNNREETLYNRHVASVDEYNAEVRNYYNNLSQALQGLNTQMQINNLQQQQHTLELRQQNQNNYGILKH